MTMPAHFKAAVMPVTLSNPCGRRAYGAWNMGQRRRVFATRRSVFFFGVFFLFFFFFFFFFFLFFFLFFMRRGSATGASPRTPGILKPLGSGLGRRVRRASRFGEVRGRCAAVSVRVTAGLAATCPAVIAPGDGGSPSDPSVRPCCEPDQLDPPKTSLQQRCGEPTPPSQKMRSDRADRVRSKPRIESGPSC